MSIELKIIIAVAAVFILLLVFALCKVSARAEKNDKTVYCKDCKDSITENK